MRSTAKVALTLGAMPIPVRLYTLQDSKGTGLVQTHIIRDENGNITHIGQVGRKNYCKVCGEELSYGEIQNGAKVTKDQLVPVFKEELDNIKPQSSKTFEIMGVLPPYESKSSDTERKMREFVQRLIALQSDKPYVLEPEEIGRKPYVLLRDNLRAEMRVAYGKITLRDREHLAIIYPYKNVLLLLTLRYLNEVRTSYIEQVAEAIKDVEIQDIEAETFRLMMHSLFERENNEKGEKTEEELQNLKDEYIENIKKLIEAKIMGQTIKIKTQEPPKPADDLLTQMKAILEAKKKEKKKVEAKATA